jgi:hypothetical protein
MGTLFIRSAPLLTVCCAVLLLGCPNPNPDETCYQGEPSPGDWSQDCGIEFCANTSVEVELVTFQDSPLPCETAGGVVCTGQTGGADYTYDYFGGTHFLMTISAGGDPPFDEASMRAGFMSMDLTLELHPDPTDDEIVFHHNRVITDVGDFDSFTLDGEHFEGELNFIIDDVELDLSEVNADCAAAGLDCSCLFDGFELPTKVIFDLWIAPF